MRCLCGCGKEAGYKYNSSINRVDIANPKMFCSNAHFRAYQKVILRDKKKAAPFSTDYYCDLPFYSPRERKTMFEMAKKGNRLVREKMKEMGITAIYDNGVLVEI